MFERVLDRQAMRDAARRATALRCLALALVAPLSSLAASQAPTVPALLVYELLNGPTQASDLVSESFGTLAYSSDGVYGSVDIEPFPLEAISISTSQSMFAVGMLNYYFDPVGPDGPVSLNVKASIAATESGQSYADYTGSIDLADADGNVINGACIGSRCDTANTATTAALDFTFVAQANTTYAIDMYALAAYSDGITLDPSITVVSDHASDYSIEYSAGIVPETPAIPEPASAAMTLAGLGLLGLALSARRPGRCPGS